MRKQFHILLSIMLVVLILALLALCAFTIYETSETPEDEDEYKGLRWIEEESYFVDYAITGDRIQFQYAICFENTSGKDMLVYPPVVTFKEQELSGWLNNEKSFRAKTTTGEYGTLIPDGEKVHVTFLFEGEYLGGDVNESLSFPVKMVLGQNTVRESVEATS